MIADITVVEVMEDKKERLIEKEKRAQKEWNF